MFAMLGIGAFFVAGLLVSIRLLALWRQTREWPELLAALGLLGIGPLGFCVLMTGYVAFRGTPLLAVFRSAGLGIQALGFIASTCFTWRVFRPTSRGARFFAIALCASLFCTGVGIIVWPFQSGRMQLHEHADILLKILVMAWGSLESLRYWRGFRRRVSLGLADPLVSASFFLWGVTHAAGALGFVVMYAAIASLGPGEHLAVAVDLLLSFIGVVSAASLYLSFLPPHFFRRRVEAQAHAWGG